MMHHKLCSKLCRLCGKEKQRGTDVFKDKVKGAVLCSIINKYFSKEVINIGIGDTFTKYVCMDCEQKICTFDEFCLMVANVQKQLAAPSLEIDFAEDMLCHLKENEISDRSVGGLNSRSKKQHTCELCAKRFRCQAHLERHKRVHTGQRPFTCNICTMSFNQQEVLDKHKGSHQGRKEFRCANCHQSFRFKVSLKSHMINFHMDLENSTLNDIDRSLSCNECGKFFATRYKLQRHSRCHTGERPYICNYCNRSFSQTGNLKLHEAKCQQSLVMSCQMQRVEDTSCGQTNIQTDRSTSQLNNPNLDYSETEDALNSAPSCSVVPSASVVLETQSNPLIHFQPMYITESEIQKTINETINSTNVDNASNSYLIKSYENPIYIDNEIENILERDLTNLETSKFTSSNVQDKLSLCLKQPETPELLHSLLYDD
ncbi:zinc finger protein 1 homolog [Venturia canescens]|uniref:zinc finger protein 1 homolog n=1 Tax=Venturia canescens TaxID=32260 RepID=UPI001C9D137D|nr:zinc finger protein 1 homolog [Venturia canescens]